MNKISISLKIRKITDVPECEMTFFRLTPSEFGVTEFDGIKFRIISATMSEIVLLVLESKISLMTEGSFSEPAKPVKTLQIKKGETVCIENTAKPRTSYEIEVLDIKEECPGVLR